MYRAACYTDRASHDPSDDFRAQLEALLLPAYRAADLAAYADLINDAEGCGAWAVAAQVRGPSDGVFIFLTPALATWSSATKGRPEFGTGVLERAMQG